MLAVVGFTADAPSPTVTGWVVCVIPLLTLGLGYLLLFFPQINRALWRSASQQAHLVARAGAGHYYALAAVDAIGVALVTLSLAGSLYVVIGLARRLTSAGLRWSAGRPGRRLLVAAAGLVCLTALATFWAVHGQFRGWYTSASRLAAEPVQGGCRADGRMPLASGELPGCPVRQYATQP